MQLHIGAYEGGREFGISGGTGTSTPDLRGDIVKLLTVLMRNIGQQLLMVVVYLPKSSIPQRS